MTATGLPDFPWDSLAALKQRASAHAGGLVDLSVGTPVDATPEVVRRALADASNAPGYPQVWGTPDLRQAVVDWFERRRGVPGLDPDGVLPTIGSKELVAWLPTQLGLGKGDTVVHPEVAYPTYDVGARLAGASPRPMRSLTGLGPMTRAS
ncbi:aminotransferase class I/II-fold pyridoxal phosphate-dependent enzyme, partial [Segeticoccus rhizosphaerae]